MTLPNVTADRNIGMHVGTDPSAIDRQTAGADKLA